MKLAHVNNALRFGHIPQFHLAFDRKNDSSLLIHAGWYALGQPLQHRNPKQLSKSIISQKLHIYHKHTFSTKNFAKKIIIIIISCYHLRLEKQKCIHLGMKTVPQYRLTKQKKRKKKKLILELKMLLKFPPP